MGWRVMGLSEGKWNGKVLSGSNKLGMDY